MIPKVIHYCWFGGAPKPPLVLRCIESWRRHAPDFVIKEWNEQTFAPSRHPFAEQMWRQRRWAFLTDYVRMRVVADEGGVYLDADCELIGDLRPFLGHAAFAGCERFFSNLSPFTACFGAEAGHPWVRDCLAYYDAVDLSDERTLARTNTGIVSDLLRARYGARTRDRFQALAHGLVLYPSPVLCTPNIWHRSVVVHHFNGSWTPGHGRTPPWRVRAYEIMFRLTPLWAHAPLYGFIGIWTKLRHRLRS
jgi:hypothetical protein